VVELEREVRAWVRAWNKARVTVAWQFLVVLAWERFAARYPKLKN
jgi:hypothetical protein